MTTAIEANAIPGLAAVVVEIITPGPQGPQGGIAPILLSQLIAAEVARQLAGGTVLVPPSTLIATLALDFTAPGAFFPN